MDELENLRKQIESIEKRISTLECIINGTASGKVGRKPKLTPEQKQDIIKNMLLASHIQNSQRNIP